MVKMRITGKKEIDNVWRNILQKRLYQPLLLYVSAYASMGNTIFHAAGDAKGMKGGCDSFCVLLQPLQYKLLLHTIYQGFALPTAQKRVGSLWNQWFDRLKLPFF